MYKIGSEFRYIHLADHIAYLSNFGLGIDGNNYKVLYEIFEKFKLTDERKDKLIESVQDETNKLLKTIILI